MTRDSVALIVSNTTLISPAPDNAFNRSRRSPAFGWHGSLTTSLWSPTQDDRLISDIGTELTRQQFWNGRTGNGRAGITSHRASRCRMPLSKASMVGCTMNCWTRPCSIAAACPCPPERWRRDYDTDSGLALADATRLRRKLAWSERSMG